MKIVILDDEKFIQDGIEKRIKKFNEDIIVFKPFNCESAKEIIEKNNIDVCFIDINMPDINGLDFINSIKDSGIDFVIISGYEKFEYAKKAIGLKVYAYLLKPIDKEEFNAVLNDLYNKYKGSDYSNNINKILKLIKENCKKNEFSLINASDMLLLSQSYICRLIKKELNSTFIELLNKERVEEAKKLIDEREDSINFKTIYSQVGFTSQQYFNVIFKKYTNMTPSQYLEKRIGVSV